jgi:branched-chain amino acid transport system permease protein
VEFAAIAAMPALAKETLALMELVLVQLFNGVQYGLVIFLAAAGLTLVFGILGVINLAHGSFYMLGAYLALSLTDIFGDIFVTLAVGIPLAAAFGCGIEWLVMRHLYKRDHLQQVLVTFALVLIFNELQRTIWGSFPHSVPIPAYLAGSIKLTATLSYPIYRLALTAICVALAAGMMLVIQKTRVGRLIRAGESNREMVELLGFDSAILFRLVFAAGVALAAAAGMVAAPVESVYPGIGERILIISFVVVVIGGIGSIRGAFLGALLIGIADAFSKVFLPDFAGFMVYALMAAVLVVRPTGLFGRA